MTLDALARTGLDALERTAFATVAITAAALADVAGGELTFLGWRALVVLGETDAPLRLGELAGRLRLSAPSASKLVRRLERRNLVTLAADPHDRRVVLLSLDEEGRRVREAVIRRRREILATALDGGVPDAFGPSLAIVAERLASWT